MILAQQQSAVHFFAGIDFAPMFYTGIHPDERTGLLFQSVTPAISANIGDNKTSLSIIIGDAMSIGATFGTERYYFSFGYVHIPNAPKDLMHNIRVGLGARVGFGKDGVNRFLLGVRLGIPVLDGRLSVGPRIGMQTVINRG